MPHTGRDRASSTVVLDGREEDGMAHHDTAGPQQSGQPAEPGRSPDAQLRQLRDDLLGGFGQGADTEQVQAHTRDRRRADATPSVFERARTSNTEGPTSSDAAPKSRRGTSPSKAAVGGFLLGVLLTVRLRRRTR